MFYNFNGTLIVVVLLKERIFLFSDGKVTDIYTGETRSNHSKIHLINDKTGLLVAGRYIPNLSENIIANCQNTGKNSILDIVKFTKREYEKAWHNLENNLDEVGLSKARLFTFISGFDIEGFPRLFYLDNMTNPRFEINERTLFSDNQEIEIGAISHGSGEYQNPSSTFTRYFQDYLNIYNSTSSIDNILSRAFESTKLELAQLCPEIGGETFKARIDKYNGIIS